MASGSGPLGSRPGGYRRRRPLPALLLIAVLGAAAIVVWLKVLGASGSTATRCDRPARPPSTVAGQPPTALGQALAPDALDRTAPAPPAQVLVRVVNASTQKGQAGEVTETLRQLGFAQVAPPANDPLYSALDLNCRAQIRFGQLGTPAARTVSLLEPCAELVKDERQDGTVDLAIGKQFDELRPKTEARRLLQQLTDWAAQHPEAQGGLQANAPAAQPNLDPALLAAARQVSCG